MPSTRHIATEQPQAVSTFSFPHHDHLLITTSSTIYAWDAAGLHIIFTSSKHGIVAAREAKDGSGMLAVADKHVVVLHDTKRGQEQSWGLQADDDEVRQLEYAQDSKWLYLSTNLTYDVQKYSTERSKLMSPTQSHPSAPVALAVSPTGHLMLSASDDPPVVYLKNLHHNTQPALIEPRASNAAVCAAVFHSERPNIFLLGFRDGTVAAYDATPVSRRNQGCFPNQETVNVGEIAHFTSLHRTTSKTVTSGGIASKSASIAGAAFLQGYKSRAVTIGSDGRCRLIDFADGGIVLRSWHAKAPLTSVSVLSIREPSSGAAKSGRSTSQGERFTLGGPTSTNNLIAVSRTDGKVQIYDSVGLLLEQKTINEVGDKILGVEWVKGRSPSPIRARPSACEMRSTSPALPDKRPIQLQQLEPAAAAAAAPKMQPKSSRRRHSTFDRPATWRQPDVLTAKRPSVRPDRRFTVHPDEAKSGEGTVKYTPKPETNQNVGSSAGSFLDLFSPVKPVEPPQLVPPQKRLTSPRPRPRISSQTFSSPTDDALGHLESNALDLNDLPPSARADRLQNSALKPIRTEFSGRANTDDSPPDKRHISFRPVQRSSVEQCHARSMSAVPPIENAKLLADLRKMTHSYSKAQRSVLAPYASSKTNAQAASEPICPLSPAHEGQEAPTHAAKARHHWLSHGKEKKRPRIGLGKQKYWHAGNVMERESTWPTDSMLEESLEADDIWITDASEKENEMSQRRRMAPLLDRPPGRQTLRSRITSKGSTSTANVVVAISRKFHGGGVQPLDGSATENFESALSHLSPDGTFSPASEDIHQLFPRASSLSPKRKKSPAKRASCSPRSPRALQEIAGNSVTRTKSAAKNPWAKAEAVKVEKCTGPGHRSPDAVQDVRIKCNTCEENSARILGLEDELARLKGEVLIMKAAMRRAGVPLPASLRTMR